jgi:hypothetical protein
MDAFVPYPAAADPQLFHAASATSKTIQIQTGNQSAR